MFSSNRMNLMALVVCAAPLCSALVYGLTDTPPVAARTNWQEMAIHYRRENSRITAEMEALKEEMARYQEGAQAQYAMERAAHESTRESLTAMWQSEHEVIQALDQERKKVAGLIEQLQECMGGEDATEVRIQADGNIVVVGSKAAATAP